MAAEIGQNSFRHVQVAEQEEGEEIPPLEQGCWAALGRKIQTTFLYHSCNGAKFLWSCFFREESIWDRITSECVQALKQHPEPKDHHYAIAHWAIRIPITSGLTHPVSGYKDPKGLQISLLSEHLLKLIPHSFYAKWLSHKAKQQPWRTLPDIIFSNARHNDCRICELVKDRAKIEKAVRLETGNKILNLFLPNARNSSRNYLIEPGDSDNSDYSD